MKLIPRDVRIGEHEYKVVFDLNSMDALERALKNGEIANPSETSKAYLVALFWSGLASHHKGLSLTAFRAQHTADEITAIINAISEPRQDALETIPKEDVDPSFPTCGLR